MIFVVPGPFILITFLSPFIFGTHLLIGGTKGNLFEKPTADTPGSGDHGINR
jgi:hypothetical protein